MFLQSQGYFLLHSFIDLQDADREKEVVKNKKDENMEKKDGRKEVGK
jgi:hypothetical protein